MAPSRAARHALVVVVNVVVVVGSSTSCPPGEYLDGSVCTSCIPGTFLNVSKSTALWPSSCDLCPGGEYVPTSGSDQGYSCPSGFYSIADRTQCVSCEAGQFVANGTACKACPLGKYAPQALNGACLDCAAGAYTQKKVKRG